MAPNYIDRLIVRNKSGIGIDIRMRSGKGGNV